MSDAIYLGLWVFIIVSGAYVVTTWSVTDDLEKLRQSREDARMKYFEAFGEFPKDES